VTSPATQREFEELLAQLDSLPPDRQAAIARMVFELVGICPVCDEPVRRCDSRRAVEVDDEHWQAHIPCLEP
jgi:hypothetical protein